MSELSALWRHPEFRRGARDMSGISVGLAASGYSLLSDRKTWLGAAVAGSAAVAAFALPLKLNIVVAIATAVAVGLLVDHGTPPVMRPAKERP